MHRILPVFAFIMLALGCAKSSDGTWKAPLVHRIDIQQGNVVDQSMIDRLKPGMDKKQVKFIMGTPLITDTFHKDRWDYLYSFEPGSGEREQRRVTLFFKDDKLDRVDGDIKITDRPRPEMDMGKERTVAVPLEDNKPGLFKRMFSKDDKETAKIEENLGPETKAPEDPDVAGTASDDEAGVTTADTESAKDETPAPETVAKANKDDETKSTAGDPGEKNLVRRFWDRMTKGGDEGDTEVETEQDRRDAEILKEAGGL